MKSFKQHLLESKQSYEFKVKLAGEPSDEQLDKFKGSLDRFVVELFQRSTRTPIQETQLDFPEHKNISVTTYDIILTYPATSFQVRQLAAESLGLSECCVKVRNLKEQEEQELNHKNDEKSGEALLGKDYEKENNQHLAGQSNVMSLLKELGKVKHQGEQYKGVNDQLLAKKAPVEKAAKVTSKYDKSIGTTSAIGSKQVTLPTAKLGKF
jgi:hypothetical protein